MTENKIEQELNDLFDGKSTSVISKVVKKAKRKTILRNIGISLFVIVFLIITLSFSWFIIIRGSQEKAMRDIELFSRITNPNIVLLGSQNESNGVFEGILTFNRYKEIEGIPVDWSNQVVMYSLFGGISRFTGNHSPIQLEDKEDGLVRYYDRETKQRMLSFYHPEVLYKQIRNDLNTLNNFTDDTLVELGVSFNQKYTLKEVRELIPENITLKWYWVDTYSEEDTESLNTNINEYNSNSTELATKIYGFSENSIDSSMSETYFIDALQMGLNYKDGKYFGEFNRIYNNLKGVSAKLAAENIEIIGVVVTGTAAELKRLEDLEMIRASEFGVTVNPNK
ncbi:anti sigma factor C-terminal domain-containing protein [Psychrobacillus sp. NPDC096623]|uniref:anti sigma factor C-terminal domain-containing protein n=1 Tax=Psychrobacillus sp. NPDC096623 TaxID=3364492 RepID=UPI00382D6E5B